MVAAILLLIVAISSRWQTRDTYNYSQFKQDLKEDTVDAIEIQPNAETPTGSVIVKLKSGGTRTLHVSDISEIEDELRVLFPSYTELEVSRENRVISYVVPVILGIVVIFIVMALMNSQAASSSSGGKMMNFGKNRATKTLAGESNVTFKDVAGLEEEKEDLEEIVDFLKDPKKYTSVGARIPKGVLLEGPPGTGKTLLAKAIAGEAGVPFFSISGSDFVEMFVGVGASRVRDLFSDAKKNAPCIVFIDEIDAVARRRGTGLGGSHDEREQTLNQLLVEMDGFGVNEGIIVMAATNRVDILDPAILRPGRFDRKIGVGRPDVKGREDILKVHSKNKPLGDDVDLTQIAQTTMGFTGADLENLMNEAAITAAKSNRKFIKMEDIRKSFIKVGIGAEKKSRVVSDRDKKITAFHEAGHAILFHVLPDVGPVYTVSIIPTGLGAAGYTMPLPSRDDEFVTKGRLINEIIVDMGGRVAEEIFCDDITTGASQDLKQATKAARSMVTRYGMSSKLGVVSYDADDDEVFIGRDLGHSKAYSDRTEAEIDCEVKSILDNCYGEAKRIILENKSVLIRCAEELLKKEKLTRDEFEALFQEKEVVNDFTGVPEFSV
ncbi:MAG: ATP-dependent zinc metalloprotease FtsH [Lachnospiraceae bacterium]|nr:ATP-dependent zinc metalloprotease FtsH [Lachnospiraceae bacterium]